MRELFAYLRKTRTQEKMKFKLTAQQPTTVLQLLGNGIDVSLYDIRRQLKAREVKVDGARIDADRPLEVGAVVEIFVPERMVLRRDRAYPVYADDRIVVAYKYADTPVERVAQDLGRTLIPVHRLDRNTAGLLVLAVDRETEKALTAAIKARAWEKRYYAEVIGCVATGGEGVVYLKKDATQAVVHIVDRPQDGYIETVTRYRPVLRRPQTTVVDIELVTGRTHQISAYFAHIGHAVVGDNKYGDAAFNRAYGATVPHLTAYRLRFDGLTGALQYLNGKIIEVEKEKIDFIY